MLADKERKRAPPTTSTPAVIAGVTEMKRCSASAHSECRLPDHTGSRSKKATPTSRFEVESHGGVRQNRRRKRRADVSIVAARSDGGGTSFLPIGAKVDKVIFSSTINTWPKDDFPRMTNQHMPIISKPWLPENAVYHRHQATYLAG